MSISPCHLSRFPIEFQLACACCRVEPTNADRERMLELLPQVDVAAFLDLVIKRHRIGPLVHANLRRLPAAALPAGLMPPLATAARGNAVKALQAVRTHVLLSRWFSEAGIEWLAFKGITIAHQHYGDVGLRHVNDHDLWVPAHRLLQARDVLARHGFAWDPRATHWDLAQRGPRHRDFLLRHHIEEQHLSAEHGQIDVHWQLTEIAGFFDVSAPLLLARGEHLPMGGANIPVMNRIDRLLYLSEHGSRHGWSRLKWLADLPQLLEHEPLDWPQVLARAQALGCLRSLLLGLALARDLFQWSPPLAVVALIESRPLLDSQRRLVRHGLLESNDWWSDPERMPQRSFLRLWLGCLLLGSWAALKDVFWRLSLSPSDLRVVGLPDRWFSLYRMARPVLFVLRRFGKGVV